MRTTPNAFYQPRLLVKADIFQREQHSFLMPDGTRKAFYLGAKYGEDNKKSKLTMAQVVTECDELKVGDVVLFTHLVIRDDKEVQHEDYPGTEKLYLIDKSSVSFYIREEEICPVGDNLLCERLYYPEEVSPGGIILSYEKKQVENRLRVLKVPPGIDEVKEGDVVVVYKFSDYELSFNYSNTEKTIIRCLFSRDVIAVDEYSYENCLTD